MAKRAKVVILGGGAGGTFVANKLARHSDHLSVTLVDATGTHHYQPGLLYVPFGWTEAVSLRWDERKLLHPRVELVTTPVDTIDPDKRRLILPQGSIGYDFLVVATGCCPAPEEVPGLHEGAYHFYTEPEAVRLRQRLEQFDGGHIVVGIAGFPYKCPPAPIEFTLLLADWLEAKGLRSRTKITFLSPLPTPFSIPSANPLVEELFADRGVQTECFFNVETVDPGKKTVLSFEGSQIAGDLLILIPPHKGAPVIEASGIGDKGHWIPTDRHTLMAKHLSRIFVVGDATDLPISKSGATAHFESPVLVENLLRLINGQEPSAHYDGSVMCLVETGQGRGTIFRFNYDRPPQPPRPSRHYHWLKSFINRFYPLALIRGWSPALLLDAFYRRPFALRPFCGSEAMEQMKSRLAEGERGPKRTAS